MEEGIDAVIASADAGAAAEAEATRVELLASQGVDANHAAEKIERIREARAASSRGTRPGVHFRRRKRRVQPRLRCQSRRRAARPVSGRRARRSARSASTSRSSSGVSASGPSDPAEEVVGEGGVAGQDRSVEVGAEDRVRRARRRRRPRRCRARR